MSIDYRLKDFIDNDLKVFSNHDNVRSIPSIIDGFKDAQRKAVFGMILHGNSEIKLSQVVGFAALKSSYHHGENSMCDTMVGLAQNFPGSNNVNLLEPIGQFGSILSPEAAASRYIYTKPSEFMRKYLRKEDDKILIPREEEGQKLEPINYFPILPMWILNGSIGIGTGHSVRILPRDPKKVSQLVEKLVSGVNVQQKTIEASLTPHFNGWKGEIKSAGEGSWELHGKLEVVNSTTIRVTELPVTYGVDKYKSILINLMDKNVVKDFDNNSSEEGFDFLITVPREVTKRPVSELMVQFKLIAKIGENITLWNTEGKLQRYNSVYEALLEFIDFRLEKYQVRKDVQLAEMDEELRWLTNKIKFITYWNTKLKDPHKKTKEALKVELGSVVEDEFFDRLLALQIRSLTMEAVKDLEKEVDVMKKARDELAEREIEDLFSADLKAL